MPELENPEAFKEILNNPEVPYLPSEKNQAIVQDTDVALFVGPSSSGRNTIITEVMETGKYYYLVSDTTRDPQVRNGELEQNGVQYWFRTPAEFLKDLRAGAYVEAAVIHDLQVSGSSVREIAKAHDEGKTAITDTEIAGVDSYLAIKPDTMLLFVLPSSLKEQIRRMRDRGGVTPSEEAKRLMSSVKEYQHALKKEGYWFVINDRLDEAVKYTLQLLETRKPDPQKQAAGQALAQLLLQQTQQYLLEKQVQAS